MSKMDALRALREARYEEEAKRGRQAGETPKRAQRAAAVRPAGQAAEAKPSTVDAPPADSGLCGHKSMNGRTCTRESGHTAKSHRYS